MSRDVASLPDPAPPKLWSSPHRPPRAVGAGYCPGHGAEARCQAPFLGDSGAALQPARPRGPRWGRGPSGAPGPAGGGGRRREAAVLKPEGAQTCAPPRPTDSPPLPPSPAPVTLGRGPRRQEGAGPAPHHFLKITDGFSDKKKKHPEMVPVEKGPRLGLWSGVSVLANRAGASGRELGRVRGCTGQGTLLAETVRGGRARGPRHPESPGKPCRALRADWPAPARLGVRDPLPFLQGRAGPRPDPVRAQAVPGTGSWFPVPGLQEGPDLGPWLGLDLPGQRSCPRLSDRRPPPCTDSPPPPTPKTTSCPSPSSTWAGQRPQVSGKDRVGGGAGRVRSPWRALRLHLPSV